MPAASLANRRRKRKNTKEARRGRPRKPHLLPIPPVSRRSSLRTPRLHLREDFYNVDEIVVDDEDEDFRELEQIEQQQEEEREEDGDDDDDFRSKKKLKLLIKLHHHQIPSRRQTPTPATNGKTRRRNGLPSLSSSDEKTNAAASGRRRRRRDRVNDENEFNGEIGHQDGSSRHTGISSGASMPWKGTPLPDSKTIISILDKIQRKDKYAVFRNPVDPEELPDYHQLIHHPMDFTTIRNKLARNLYSNLDQFESDVFLLCSNAMQYNPPETIYFKQARSMQELAGKKFQAIRDEIHSCEIISNVKQMDHSNPVIVDKMLEDQPNSFSEEPQAMENQPDTLSDKPTERSTCSSPNMQDRSEISPSTDLATNAENISSDNKSSSLEEDRRSTYITSRNQQQGPIQVDPTFNTLDDEKKLVAVGLDEESSYARSLARFAASLGPTAWRIASEKIAKATPSGLKFGPGWVGEYETYLAPIFSSNTESTNRHRQWYRKDKDNGVIPKPAVDDGKLALFGFRLGNRPENESDMFHQWGDNITKHSADNICNSNSNRVNSYFLPANLVSPGNHGFQDIGFNNRSRNSSKKVDDFTPSIDHSIMKGQGLFEGQVSKNSMDHKMNASLGVIPTTHDGGTIDRFSPHGATNQKIDDHVQIIRMLPENVHSYPNSYCTSTSEQLVSPRNPFVAFGSSTTAHPRMPTIRSCTGHGAMEALGNSEVQIRSWSNSNRPTWMLQRSLGSGLHSNLGFEDVDRRQKQKPSQPQTVPKPSQMVGTGHGVLSRFEQGNQSQHWQGLGPHAQQRQSSKSSVPPDLNIGFQSPSSPPVQQQPDLALQL